MNDSQMKQKVFLSFAANDRDRVEHVLSQLQKSELATVNFEVNFEPEANEWNVEFHPGEDFRANIRDRVQSANQVVVFWSADAATSQYVQYELGMADALDKPITIVQLDRTMPQLPAHLLDKVVQVEDLSTVK